MNILKFISDYIKYNLSSICPVRIRDMYPCLFDKKYVLPRHYPMQDSWTIRKVMGNMALTHYCFGDRIDGLWLQLLAAGCLARYVDINPPPVYEHMWDEEDIRKLSYKDGSINSASCMHVLEHIGLGRYGDEIDPDGWKKGLRELQRVVRKRGNLYISVPIGESRVRFNGHRIFNPYAIIQEFGDMGWTCEEFSAIDDDNVMHTKADPADYVGAKYSLGIWWWRKKNK